MGKRFFFLVALSVLALFQTAFTALYCGIVLPVWLLAISSKRECLFLIRYVIVLKC